MQAQRAATGPGENRPSQQQPLLVASRRHSSSCSPVMLDPVSAWTAYNEQLDKNPLTAKACTSLVGWALGDLLAQVSKKQTNNN